ncbi:unnamed protein product [Trifolium pratense]|uniref:Uncharacterized protein n=1 Tax=Trifolium pratense TaxID=57577 RepID=A0ACB0KV45_TRIPR|nr:unnamed protein product [Trifolium pratense]
MASEQLFRRENKTNERDVHVEKDRVPKMTTHFEHLSVTEQKLPQGSIDALQGGEINKDHAGKAIRDIGGIEKARETYELGSNFQSLSDLNKNESYRDHAYVPVNANSAGNRAENRVGGKASGDIGGIGKARENHELGSNFHSLPDRSENQSYLDRARGPGNANLAGNRAENRVGEKESGKAIGDIGGIGKARETHELGSNFHSLPDRSENQSYLDRARGPGNANLAGNRAENRVGEKESGKAIGDIGGIGKSREAHELGSNFQSLPDRNENQSYLDRARVPVNANVAGNRAENRVGAKEDFGAVRDVGKFQMESIGGNKGLADDREKLKSRTRVVTGTPQMKETNRGMGTGQVMAEKGTKTGGRVVGAAENQGTMWGKNAEREMEEEKGRMKLGETRGRKIGAEDEVAMLGKNASEQREKAREEEEKRSTLEEITKYRNQAQQSAMEAISAAQERAAQAKDVTKDTVSNAAKTATDYAYPAAEKAKNAALQAKDVTVETGMTAAEKAKCAAAQAKETGMTAAEKAKNAALQAKDVTVETGMTAAEKAKAAAAQAKETGLTAAEKAKNAALQAKDVTVETGMTAAEKAKAAAGVAGKVAVDLKDKATVAGWTAAHYSTKLAVDGTKAAANAVEGAAGYVVPKAAELASKSVDVVKGLASSTGETAKEFTAKKKDQSWREYEAKRVSGQLQEGEEIMPTSGQNVSNYTTQNVMPSGERTQAQGRGSNVMSSIGETVGNVGEKVGETMENVGDKMKKPFENMTSSGQVQGNEEMMMKNNNKALGGSDVLGAVTETVSDIGSNIIKTTENTANKVKNTVTQEAQSGGVLDAIGETIAEIAHTTKVMVVGEDEEDVEEIRKKNIVLETHSIDRAKHEGNQAPKNVF